MNDVILTGLFGIGGTLLGGIISFIATKRGYELGRLKENNQKLGAQVKAYWQLEELYSKELADLKSISSKTVKMEYREKVSKLGLERPVLTKNTVDRYLQ